ncbi:MAG: ATP-binding protein [Candidatus Saccharicenans sp.]
MVVDLEISQIIKDQVNHQRSGAVQDNLKTIQPFLEDRLTDLASVAKVNGQDLSCLEKQDEIYLHLVKEKKWYDFIYIFIKAAQAMPEGGRLRVTTSEVKFEDLIQIKVSDTGFGLSPKDLKKIFDPFFTT